MANYIDDSTLRTLLEGYSSLMREEEYDYSAQIALAEDWANGYLNGAGIGTPVIPVPGALKLAAANYAAYLILQRANSTAGFEDQVTRFHDEAYRLIRDFVSGISAEEHSRNVRKDMSIPQVVNPNAD